MRARHTLPQAKDFIRRLLVLAAAARMTMVEALAHPWLAAVGAEEDGAAAGGLAIYSPRRPCVSGSSLHICSCAPW